MGVEKGSAFLLKIGDGGAPAAYATVAGMRTTQLIAFDAAPVEGALLTAGFRFDVPVRFAEDRLDINRATFAAGEAPSVPLVEIGGADEAALAQGRNLCLIGRELVQFARVAQTGAASFRLEGLRRGLCGTEWAMASHVAGEGFLLLEEDRLAQPFAGQEGVREIGSSVRIAAIGVGDSEPVEAMLTISGEAVTPPSPVHATVRPDGAGGWIIGWTRRSRAGWRWISGADVPLGEEREGYEVRVLSGGTLVRREKTGLPGWNYDAAMLAADGGGAGAPTVEIRQIGSHALGRPVRVIIGG